MNGMKLHKLGGESSEKKLFPVSGKISISPLTLAVKLHKLTA